MSDANNEQLLPPPSWDKFEEICADLFSRIWGDTLLGRYGRTGQRQHGVDIYGKENGADSGVQCKGKRNWPQANSPLLKSMLKSKRPRSSIRLSRLI